MSACQNRPFSACSSLMSFSSFSRFLWLLSLLVASSLFFLFSLGPRMAPFFVCDFFVCGLPGPYSTQLFPLLVLFSAVCRAWIHFLCSFFSLGLFFGLLVFSDSVLRNLQGCFYIYFFLSFFCLRLVLRPLFSDSVVFG